MIIYKFGRENSMGINKKATTLTYQMRTKDRVDRMMVRSCRHNGQAHDAAKKNL